MKPVCRRQRRTGDESGNDRVRNGGKGSGPRSQQEADAYRRRDGWDRGEEGGRARPEEVKVDEELSWRETVNDQLGKNAADDEPDAFSEDRAGDSGDAPGDPEHEKW